MNNKLAVRTISGVVFAVVMLACLLFNQFLFGALILFIMSVMMSEFYKMTMGDNYRFSRLLAIAGGWIAFILVFCHCAYGMHAKFICLSVVPMLVVMINSLYVKNKSEFGKFSFIYSGILYIALPLILSNLIAFHGDVFNTLLLLCFFVIIWCSDVGAYVFGMAWGQKYGKKLAPAISPKKSWIGFWGGMFFAVLASVVLNLTGVFTFPLIHCVILAILMDVAGVYGDLFESQWKRYCDVKDSGNIIPGHGGMLDRFDSALFAIPVGAIYLAIMNLL